MNTIVQSCTCVHKQQDEIHGKGRRVFNYAKKNESWRCTVCKREVREPVKK
jgi:hypothetical protein